MLRTLIFLINHRCLFFPLILYKYLSYSITCLEQMWALWGTREGVKKYFPKKGGREEKQTHAQHANGARDLMLGKMQESVAL